MKTKTKITITAMTLMAAAIQGFAEFSSAATDSSIAIDNTVPEPTVMLAIIALIIFRAVR